MPEGGIRTHDIGIRAAADPGIRPRGNTECLIFTAFPLQQWLHESVSALRFTYTVLLQFSILSQLLRITVTNKEVFQNFLNTAKAYSPVTTATQFRHKTHSFSYIQRRKDI